MNPVFPGSGVLPSGTSALSPATPAERPGAELERPPPGVAGSANDLSAVIMLSAAFDGDGPDEGTGGSWQDQVLGPLRA